MELGKKKYKRDEVITILAVYKKDYESKLKEQMDRIAELSAENKSLLAEISDFKNKNNSISSALMASEEKSEELLKRAEERYSLTVESLRAFARKWRAYFDYIADKYPHYGATKEAKSVFDKLTDVLSDVEQKEIVETLDTIIPQDKISKGQNKVFDPQSKIDDYIAATGDNGFNLDEVLNPGKLELEDLCKELGLIEDL